MAMAACYPSAYYPPPPRPRPEAYLHHHQQQQPQQPRQLEPAYLKPVGRIPPPPDKDYSVPLHVDCSVEYELPDCAKPPQGVKVEPLLMIHPCHFRNLERQRRRPFENNLPNKPGRCCEYSDCTDAYPNTKYRAVRSHPYAAPPCAPRPQEVAYPLHHHQPTLIYNV